MKHTCEHCTQRYDIPDEKVMGKILKVRCKTCSGVMSVMGPQIISNEEQRPPTLTGVKPYKPNGEAQNLEIQGRVWWCGIGGRAHGPFRVEELERLIERGDVHARTRMWRNGMSSWMRISESPSLSWLMEMIMQRTAEDKELLAGRDPSCVFDRAGLLSDGNGYFPNPTLKSGWLVLDEETQNYLETCAREASWLKNNQALPEKTPRTNLMLRAALMGAAGAAVCGFAMQMLIQTPQIETQQKQIQLQETLSEEGDISNDGTGFENALAYVLP